MTDDDWKTEAAALFPKQWWGYWFGMQIQIVAGFQHAYDLGAGRVPLTLEPDGVGQAVDDAGALWYPGCGFPALQALVRCQWCMNVYRQIGSSSAKQGVDCCAWIWAEMTAYPGYTEPERTGRVLLQAGYGSCYDTSRFVAVGENPLINPNWNTTDFDPVCDRCIATMLNDGWWKREEGHHL